ncbi:pyruvate kinase [Chytriomyces confervae]|uniref:Pyruvate kinase n=1 Tax=Chytriomyces confervae TaxID=246404 RepID=A0A507EXB9_9FUNG|nr:pyruvate kinase [Chytriomyces confervae]
MQALSASLSDLTVPSSARDGGDVLRTKICCTIGPASYGYDNIGRLIEGGMNVARLNLSHCTREEAETVITDMRRYLKEKNTTAQVAIWLDINGPKVRTGKLAQPEVYLKAGDEFTFVNDATVIGDNTKVTSTYTKELLKVGDKLFVDDGLLSFTVKERVPEGILCSIDNSGTLGESKGINMPSYVIEDLPAVSSKDALDISFAMKHNVDFITVSCIRTLEDIQASGSLPYIISPNTTLPTIEFGYSEVRLLLGNSKTKVLAKIENKRGLDNFEDILKTADGIVIDRGYLGAEVDIEIVTMEQKRMIMLANIMGKSVMVANQMFESMKTNPRPTRSEAADTANAVMDGADGLVLSAETAIGHYVFEALDVMRRVAAQAEKNTNYLDYQVKMTRSVPKPISVSESIASSAVLTASQVNAAIIIVVTELGGTARLVAKYRPQIPVIAATLVPQTARQLAATFGLVPYYHDGTEANVIEETVNFAVELGLCKPGDIAVITSGQSVGFLEGTTTQMQLYTIPDIA